MSKIFSRTKLADLFTNRYLSVALLVLIQILLIQRPSWNRAEIKIYQRYFNIVSTSHTDVVSTLCNVENPPSDFVSFSRSDQRYSNVDPQRWNNVNPTLKCWLSHYLKIHSGTVSSFCLCKSTSFFLGKRTTDYKWFIPNN